MPRPARPTARRREGLDRVDPSHRRGHHRLRDPGPRHPRHSRLPRPSLDPVAVARGGRPGRVPGVAGARDGPPRQQRRIGHRAPRGCAHACGPARLPDRSRRLPGPDRRPRGKPAIHAVGSLHDGRHLRPPSVRLARDGDRLGAGLPRLAADERVAPARRLRGHLGPRPASLGGGPRRADRGRFGHRRLENATRPSDARPAVSRRGRPLRDPGRDRRPAGDDPAVRVDADAPPRPGRRHLGVADRADRDQLLHGPRGCPRRGGSDGRDGPRDGARCADDGRHDPRVHRPDQAADHRAAPGHDRAGHGPRDPRPPRREWRDRLGRLGRARLLDDARRHAGGGQRQRHQLLSRPRHRPADDEDPPPTIAGPPGRAGARGRLRYRPRRDLVRGDGLLRQPDGGLPDPARDRASTSSSTRSGSSVRRRRTSSSVGRQGRCHRSSAGRP